MDIEIVDYTNENFSLDTQLYDPNSILFSTRPRISSSESSQEMGAANLNFIVSVNMTYDSVCNSKDSYVVQGRNQAFSSSNHSQEMGAANFLASANTLMMQL